MSSRATYKRFVSNYTNTPPSRYSHPTAIGNLAAAPVHRPESPKTGLPKRKSTKSNKKSKGKRVKSRNPRKRLIFRYREENIRGISAFMVITIAVIFIGLTSVCVSFALNKEAQLQIAALNKDLQKLQEDGRIISLEISEKYDIAAIEQIAINKLDMNKPRPDQMVSINVPPQSSVVQYKPSNWQDTEKNELFVIISDYIKKSFSFLGY